MDCVKWKVIFATLLLLALTSLITDVFAHTEISYAVLPLTEHSEPYTKHLLDLIRSTPMLYLIEPPAREDVIVRVVLTVYENGTVKNSRIMTKDASDVKDVILGFMISEVMVDPVIPEQGRLIARMLLDKESFNPDLARVL